MTGSKLTIASLLMTTMFLAGCNESAWTKPPNVMGSGIVESIGKTSTSSSVVYDVKLTDSDPSDLDYIKVSGGNRITDSDIAPSIGKRVAIKCYREPHDYCYVSSYSYEGRDLDVRSK